MKKRLLVMILTCSMLAGIVACGKDTREDSNAQPKESSVESQIDNSVEESAVSMAVQSTVTIELDENEEGALAP